MMIETGILDVMRLYLSDAVEFVSDLHTLLKLKVCGDKMINIYELSVWLDTDDNNICHLKF